MAIVLLSFAPDAFSVALKTVQGYNIDKKMENNFRKTREGDLLYYWLSQDGFSVSVLLLLVRRWFQMWRLFCHCLFLTPFQLHVKTVQSCSIDRKM